MNRLFPAITCLLLLTISTFADKEYEDHGHDHHHHYHHHDHDGRKSIANNETFIDNKYFCI